jgi:hypothetical protein
VKTVRIACALALAACSLAPSGAHAATVKTGGNLSLPEPLSGNAYVAAWRADVAGSVEDDLVVVSAAEADISGDIGGDLTVLGYQVSVSGDVAGDLRVAGGFVVVSGDVGGDLVAAGGRVLVLPGVRVGGQTVAAGGNFLTGGAFAESLQTLWAFFSIASTVVLGLALAYGARVFAQEAAALGAGGVRSFLGSAAAGLLAFILLPVVSVLAVASIFALPVGVLGALATAAFAVLAPAFGALAVGLALERALRGGKDATVSYRAVGLGAFALAALGLLPGGAYAKLLVSLAGAGAAARVFARRLRGDGWTLEKVIARWGGAEFKS